MLLHLAQVLLLLGPVGGIGDLVDVVIKHVAEVLLTHGFGEVVQLRVAHIELLAVNKRMVDGVFVGIAFCLLLFEGLL